MAKVSNEYDNAFCEVKTIDNELLLLGRVFNIVYEPTLTFDIRSSDGEKLLNMPFGSPVKLALRKNSDFSVMGGLIYATNEKFWRISDITTYQNVERRQFFRVKSHAKSQITKVGNDDGSRSASLVDISLSGVKFTSDAVFSIDDKIGIFELSLTQNCPALSFTCSIVEQILVSPALYSYRCKIEDISNSSSDLLCKAIFELQRDDIKKRRRRV